MTEFLLCEKKSITELDKGTRILSDLSGLTYSQVIFEWSGSHKNYEGLLRQFRIECAAKVCVGILRSSVCLRR